MPLNAVTLAEADRPAITLWSSHRFDGEFWTTDSVITRQLLMSEKFSSAIPSMSPGLPVGP